MPEWNESEMYVKDKLDDLSIKVDRLVTDMAAIKASSGTAKWFTSMLISAATTIFALIIFHLLHLV